MNEGDRPAPRKERGRKTRPQKVDAKERQIEGLYAEKNLCVTKQARKSGKLKESVAQFFPGGDTEWIFVSKERSVRLKLAVPTVRLQFFGMKQA